MHVGVGRGRATSSAAWAKLESHPCCGSCMPAAGLLHWRQEPHSRLTPKADRLTSLSPSIAALSCLREELPTCVHLAMILQTGHVPTIFSTGLFNDRLTYDCRREAGHCSDGAAHAVHQGPAQAADADR